MLNFILPSQDEPFICRILPASQQGDFAMKLTLAVIAPHNHEGEHIRVRRSPFLIGREAGCHWRAKSPLIDTRHCALLIRGDKIFLASFAENRTLVNDVQVQGEVEVHERDCVKAGCLTFTIRIENESSQPLSIPAPASSIAGDEEAVAAYLLKEEADQRKGDAWNPSATTSSAASREAQCDEASKSRWTKAKLPSRESPETAAAFAQNLLQKHSKRTPGPKNGNRKPPMAGHWE
jgi:predicted component of type VI protein secretion system